MFCGFRPLTQKKNWPFTRCFWPEPPVHGHVVSAVTAASAAIGATLKAHPLQRTSFAAGNCQVDGGICDVHPSFRFLKATRNKNSTCNVIKVVNFLKC